MANHKSAAKRARQSLRRGTANTARKNRVRTSEKTLAKAIVAKKADEARTLLVSFMSEMMKAAKCGVIKAETASRKIGRISKQVQALSNT